MIHGLSALVARDRVEELHKEVNDIIDKEAWPVHCNIGMAESEKGTGHVFIYIQAAGLPDHWERVAKPKVEELLRKYTTRGLYHMKGVSALVEVSNKALAQA